MNLDPTSIVLSARFEDPNLLQGDDAIVLKFWRNDLFASAENNAKIGYQSTVEIPVSRQIDHDQAQFLDSLA